MEILPKLTADE